MGQALAWAGYINPSPANQFPVQPSQAVQAIRFFAGPIPALLLVFAIFFAWFYPISREQHLALRKELENRSMDS